MSRRTRNTPEMLEAGKLESERIAYEMEGPFCENCGAAAAMFRGRSKLTYCDEACAARNRDLDCTSRTPTHAELALAISREAK